MSDKKQYFCKNLISKYMECLQLNIDVFGKETGKSLCRHLEVVIEYTECNIPINGVSYTQLPEKVENNIEKFKKSHIHQ